MNRLFRRFALLVLLAMTLASAVIYLTFRLLFGDPLEQIARRQAAGQIFLLEQYIDQAPADEWLPRLNKVREVSEVTLELQPLATALAALPARQHAALLRGEVVMDVTDKAYYRRVDLRGMRYIGSDDDVIHAQHLPIDIGEALNMEAIRFGLIALFLLVPIGWWSRRHWRGLQSLSQMADAFGRGNLTARASVERSASIAPLAGHINGMAERIAALLEARRHLLHSVSHELRTPIARLEFGMELLRERHAGDDEALLRRLDAMETDVGELKALVNELLSLNQLDHTQPCSSNRLQSRRCCAPACRRRAPSTSAPASRTIWANCTAMRACWRAPSTTCWGMRLVRAVAHHADGNAWRAAAHRD
jgi:two-component system OmpR family sensor kinase